MIQLSKRFSKLFESGNFIILIGILSLLPFLLLSIFNNPSADDFCYSNYSRDLGFLGLQIEAYNGWTGRYVSTAFMGVKGFVSGTFMIYKVIPVLVLVFFFLAIYHLNNTIFKGISIKGKVVLSSFVLVLYLIQMPSTSQGFYWLAGSVTYQLSIIWSLYLLSFFIRFNQTKKIKYLVLASVFAFLVVGSNEIALVFINLIFGSVFLHKLIMHKKVDAYLLGLLIFMGLFSLVVVLSPGSSARATTYPGNQQFVFSILKSIKATKRHLGDWLPTIIIALFILFDYFNKNISIKTPQVFKVNLFLPFLIVFGFLIIGVFPVYYSLKWVPLRVVNLVYFFFLLGIIYLAFILFFKLKSQDKKFLTFSKWTRYLLLVLVFIKLGGDNNIRKAYSDLFLGKAYNYDKALKKRYHAIKNNQSDTLVVSELTNLPKTIFFEDIRSNSKHWINQCYASYFKQKAIKVKPKVE